MFISVLSRNYVPSICLDRFGFFTSGQVARMNKEYKKHREPCKGPGKNCLVPRNCCAKSIVCVARKCQRCRAFNKGCINDTHCCGKHVCRNQGAGKKCCKSWGMPCRRTTQCCGKLQCVNQNGVRKCRS